MEAPPRSPAASALAGDLELLLGTGRVELPLLSRTATQVVALCNDEDGDARRLAELVHGDQAMTAHLLRVANSSIYAPSVAIVSLQQAVSRLGMRAIRDIAVAIAVKGKVFGVAGFEERMRELWLHSACAAAYAQEIARVRRRNVEGAFLCGLLHDVGRPLVLQSAVDCAGERRIELDTGAAEELMGRFHTEVGELLVERWCLPDWVGAAIAGHHAADPSGEHREYALTTSLADQLAHRAIDPQGGADPTAHGALGELGLYEEDVEELVRRSEPIVEAARSLG